MQGLPEALGLALTQGVSLGYGFGLFAVFVDEARGGSCLSQGVASGVVLSEEGAKEPEPGGFLQGLGVFVFQRSQKGFGGVGAAQEHLVLVHPVARQGEFGGIGLLFGAQIACIAAVWQVGGPAVVVVVDHFGFIEGQVEVVSHDEAVALQCAVLGEEVVVGVEEVGVIRHVEHSLKANLPRVDLFAFFGRFADEHGGGAVELFGQLRIGFGAEDGAGSGVGVDEGELFGGQGEPALLLFEMADVGGEKKQIGPGAFAQGQQAEFVTPMNTREYAFSVFEVDEAYQFAPFGDVREVGFGAIICGDARGDDHARASLLGAQAQHLFGKEGVEVDVAYRREGEAAGAHEEAGGFGGVFGPHEGLIERGMFGFQGGDHAVARRGVLGARDFGCPGGEKLSFLQFDLLPRRIAQHTIEAPFFAKDVGEGQVPVEKAVSGGELSHIRFHPFVDLLALGQEAQVAVGGHEVSGGLGFCGEEGGGVEVLFDAHGLKLSLQLLPGLGFGPHILDGLFGHLGDAPDRFEVVAQIDSQPFGVGSVLFGQRFADLFVVAAEGFVGFVGDALFEQFAVIEPHQGVAALDLAIQKPQRFAGLQGFEPEGGFAQLHGQGVEVHTVDAVAYYLPQGVAILLLGGLATFGEIWGEVFGDLAGCREQKVARSAGRVDDAKAQQRRHGIVGCGQTLFDDGDEGGADELLHQIVRGVIGAREFAGRARRMAQKAKGRGGGMVDLGDELQQRFVD